MADETTAPSPTLHGLLEAVASRDPNRLALLDLESRLTFAELWERTGRVAAALVAAGVKPRDVVVVALPRSIDTVVGCFAILRAGAVFLPLDLRIPTARNRKLVDAASARWAFVRGALPPECVLHLQAIEIGARSPEAAPPFIGVEGHDDAGLIFTSGSSGEAKGVRVSHEALALRSRVEIETYGFTAADVYLFRTSPAFVGLAVGLTILAGGVTTAVANEEAGDNAELLLDLIRALKATFVPLSPRLVESVLDAPDLEARTISVRSVRSAGEALAPKLARRFHTALPSCRLIDGYGTTETSGVIASRIVKGPGETADSDWAEPLESVRIRLAAGATPSEGEIEVSTPMLASGYLGGEPDDDRRFLEESDPAGGPPIRWYRTGDRGCLSPVGGLKVLGRLDLQLNIDGVRAEPSEIEKVLRLHDSVADAAVRTWPDAVARNRLVAYIVDRGEPATAAALRTFASLLLPRTLIPMRFVRLGTLPLTVSGKVDRESLPNPGLSTPSAEAPRDRTEAALLTPFREVLGVSDLGVEDDFFDWGGDSLKAVALMMKIDEVAGIRLSAAVLLDAPTVAALARQVARGKSREVDAAWLRREGDLPPLVCLPGLAGDPMWFLPLIDAVERRQPVLGLSFVGLKPPLVLATAADLAVETLRTVQPHGPYLLLGHSLGGVLAFEMARRLQARSETVAFVGLIDTFVPGAPRVSPTSRGHRFRRWRNRTLGPFLDRLGPWLRGGRVQAPRPPSMFVPGLKVAARNHRVAPCDLEVTLFRAHERSAVNDLASDWRSLARGGVEVIDIPGHHFDLLSGGRARELSARIAEVVRRRTT